MAGRPSKMTPEVQEKILSALRAGNFRGVACAYAGIGQRTLREWMQFGEAKPKSRFGAFRRQVVEAEKSAEMRMVALVMKAATSDARHAEWWLERKANARWGRQLTKAVEKEAAEAVRGAAVEARRTLLGHLSAEELFAIVDRGAGDGAGDH